MIQEAAVLAIGALLSLAAWQDVKTREIDVKIFAAAAVPAAVLISLNWHSPLYLFSLAVGAVLALLTRLLGSGYADSLALALISTAPPLAFLPAPFIAVMAGSLLLPATMLWLYLKNRGRPCKMKTLERLTHICVSREEFAENPLKFIVGDVKDMERYDPAKVEVQGWVKAKYGLPYLLSLTLGYWA
ncbi:MAG: prepilin peptidase, partial [Pyrobaculum sp.]|nr:prepilin peptidase [Pyrobaculum sp.]